MWVHSAFGSGTRTPGSGLAQRAVVSLIAAQDTRLVTAMFAGVESYERFMGRWSRLLAPAFADFAGVRERERVLDVGTGTGALARSIAERCPDARVVGVDPARAFVAHAAQAPRSRPSSGASFCVGDARALPFADASFDRCVSLLALNFVPDPKRAARELRRVARTGGVVAAAVWDYGDGMTLLRTFWDAAVELEPDAERCDEKHLPLCRAGELAELWRDTGLFDVETTSLCIEQSFASFDDCWSPFLSGTGPAGAWVASLDAARRSALRDRLRQRLLGDRAESFGGPLTLPARAWATRGRVS